MYIGNSSSCLELKYTRIIYNVNEHPLNIFNMLNDVNFAVLLRKLYKLYNRCYDEWVGTVPN